MAWKIIGPFIGYWSDMLSICDTEKLLVNFECVERFLYLLHQINVRMHVGMLGIYFESIRNRTQ